MVHTHNKPIYYPEPFKFFLENKIELSIILLLSFPVAGNCFNVVKYDDLIMSVLAKLSLFWIPNQKELEARILTIS